MKTPTMAVLLTSVVIISFYTAPGALAAVSGGVSPGAVDSLARVRGTCPTFSWEAVEETLFYEVVAYELPIYLDDLDVFEADLRDAEEVMYTRVPGGATSWTPSMDEGLAPGLRYVWFVRAVEGMDGGEITAASEWSAGRFFVIPAAPSEQDVSEALEVLRAYTEIHGGLVGRTASEASSRRQGAAATDIGAWHKSTVGGDTRDVGGAPAAIRGEHPEAVTEAYGVIGSSDSPLGAGLAAVNTADGPDLVLDGSQNGNADTIFKETGIDRASPDDQVFAVRNTGEGEVTFSVKGSLVTTNFSCVGCVETASLGVGAVTTSDIRANAVTGDKIDDLTITSADLASGAVTSSKILDGSITGNKLATGAVTSTKILNGTITAADLATGSVGTAEIINSTITNADLADGSVGSSEIINSSIVSADIANGTITADDLGTSSVGTDEISNGSITGTDLGANCITAVKVVDGSLTNYEIQDGTLTAADVNPNGGIYSSKGAVYEVEDSLIVAGNGGGDVALACNDANDLPLATFKRIGHPDLKCNDVTQYWNSLAHAAKFTAECGNHSSSSIIIEASMMCISVPG